MICGILPPHAVKVATFRKGDVFNLVFERNDKFIEKLQKKGHVDMLDHPKTIQTWGRISAIGSTPYLEFRALTHKDRKTKMLQQANDYAKLRNLENADVEATNRNLTTPV